MANKRGGADNIKTRWKLSRHHRSAAGPPEEKLKKLRSSRDPSKNLPKKISKSSKRKMKKKSSKTAVKAVKDPQLAPAVLDPLLAAHIAPPRRAAAATAQAISEAQQVYESTELPPEYKRNKAGQIEMLGDSPTKPRKYRVAKKAKEFVCGRPPESSSTLTVEEEKPKTSQHENKNLLPEIKSVVEDQDDPQDDEDRIKADYMEARERMAREIIAIEMKERLAKEATLREKTEDTMKEANKISVKEVFKNRVLLETAVKEDKTEIGDEKNPQSAQFTHSSEEPEDEDLEDEDVVRDENLFVNRFTETTKSKNEDLKMDKNTKESEGEEKAQTSKASPRDVSEEAAPPSDFDLHHNHLHEERRPDYEESPVSKELAVLLSTVKDQYMTMLARMQAPSYTLRIQGELREELGRRNQLTKRVSQLQGQVGELLQDSLGLLSTGLNNLGIPAQTPQQFVTQAKSIVCKHNNMYSTVKELEEEVKLLEEQQEGLIKAKEEELVREMTVARLASGLPVEESSLIQEAKRKVGECVAGVEKHQQGKRGYSLTKVDSDQNNNNKDQGGGEAKLRRVAEEPSKPHRGENLVKRSEKLVDPRMLPNSALWEIQRVQRISTQGMPENMVRSGPAVQVDQGRMHSSLEKQEKAKVRKEDASMLDHINRQIEKSMRAGRGATPYGGVSGAPVARPPSVPYSESRLTQVIEESLLGPRPPAPAPPLEGLACPRGRLTPKDLCSPPMVGSRPPSTNSKASVGSLHTPSPVPMPEMDDRHHQRQQQGLVAAQAFLQHQASLISGPGLLAGHPQTGMVTSSSGIPHNFPQGGLVPTSSLILQHPPSNLGLPPHNTRRPGDEARRWQDEISHGFERLVALASKVDKRKQPEGDQVDHQRVECSQANQGPSVPFCNPSSTPYIPCPVNSTSLHFKKKYFAQQYQAQHHNQEQGSSQDHS